MPSCIQRSTKVAQLAKGIGIETRRSGINFRFLLSFSIDPQKAIAPGGQIRKLLYWFIAYYNS